MMMMMMMMMMILVIFQISIVYFTLFLELVSNSGDQMGCVSARSKRPKTISISDAEA
jgi:hypothetical protein